MVEGDSGLSEESFLTPDTYPKDETAKTEEVERREGKIKELNTLVEFNVQLSNSIRMAMNGPLFEQA
jgi:hypothetical protein